MNIHKGGIFLANLNPQRGTETGKVRPVLVLQSNMLNENDHPSTIVAPLTSQLLKSKSTFPLRFRIVKRENLDLDSDVLLDQPRAIDNKRIIRHLCTLSLREQLQIDEQLKIILDVDL